MECKCQLLLELRKYIVDESVRGVVGLESEDLENKTWWLESGKEGQVFAFFVHEKSAVGFDGRVGVDVIKSGGRSNGEIEVVE